MLTNIDLKSIRFPLILLPQLTPTIFCGFRVTKSLAWCVVLYISLSFVLFFWPSARLRFSEEIRRMYFCHKNIHTFRGNHMFIIMSNCSKFYYVQKTWYPPTQETLKEHGILQHKTRAANMVSSNTREAQRTWYPPTQETRKEHGILQHKRLAKNMVSLKKETDKEHVILQSRKIHIYVPSLEQVV